MSTKEPLSKADMHYITTFADQQTPAEIARAIAKRWWGPAKIARLIDELRDKQEVPVVSEEPPPAEQPKPDRLAQAGIMRHGNRAVIMTEAGSVQGEEFFTDVRDLLRVPQNGFPPRMSDCLSTIKR